MHYSFNYSNYHIVSDQSANQYDMIATDSYDFDDDAHAWAYNAMEFDRDTSITDDGQYQDIYKERKGKITGTQRKAANERERRRMNSINQGFDELRNRLPSTPCDRKLSKVDTLKTAMQYIQQLKTVLENDSKQDGKKTRTSIQQQHKIVIEGNGIENTPSIYMVSWRRLPEKFGGVHQTIDGPIVYQNGVWHPPTEAQYPLQITGSDEEDI